MGNYEQLKQSVSDVIKTNGNQEITGSILQNVLLTIISSVGANATFAGIATPTTNPGTPDGPVFYLASESGTYSNFGSIELQDGLSVLMWNGSWSSQQVFGIDDEPTPDSDNIAKSGGIANMYGSYTENPEFAEVKLDAEKRILEATYKDGTKLLPAGVKVGGAIEHDGANVTTISNPEFVAVWLDSSDRILFGIRSDADILFGYGVPSQIKDYIKEKLAELSLDEYEDIVAFLADLEKGDVTLQDLLNKKVDGEYVENPEYIDVKTDAEGKTLEATEKDGSKVIGGNFKVLGNMEVSGVSYKVIENLEYLAAWLDAEDKIIFGLKVDGKTYVGDADFLDDIENIKAFLQNITDKNIDWDALSSITAVENPEFIEAKTDSEGKLLAGRTPDGAAFENVGFTTPKVSINGHTIENSEDPEGISEVTTDSEKKIISYRDKKGVLHEEVGITLSESAMSDFKAQLDIRCDWSRKNSMYIPEPRLAHLNIVGAVSLENLTKEGMENAVEGRNYNVPVMVEFFDGDGNYFMKYALLSGQGRSSLNFPKKGLSFDFFNENPASDNFDEDNVFEIKFGDWIPQDSFHCKSFYTDWPRCTTPVVYKLTNEVMKTRGVMEDRPYKKYYIGDYSDSATAASPSDLSHNMETGARCVPDGFPVIVYYNGEFWGVNSLQLKKHRDNYLLKKSKDTNVHLDGDMGYRGYQTCFWEWNGTIDWEHYCSGFAGIETRNPKNLYCVDGKKYNADTHNKEIIDTATAEAWIAAGVIIPTGKTIDNELAGYLRTTGKVRKHIEDLTTYVPLINGMAIMHTSNGDISIGNYGGDYDVTKNFDKGVWVNAEGRQYMSIHSSNTGNPVTDVNNWYDITTALADIKGTLEEMFDINSFIDYILISNVVGDTDCWDNNGQFVTWGKLGNSSYFNWSVNIYDKDISFGCRWDGAVANAANNSKLGADYVLFKFFWRYYYEELKDRYTELRDAGIFEPEHITQLFRDWMNRVGYTNYVKEYKKWPNSPCFSSNGFYGSIYRIYLWTKKRIEYMDASDFFDYNRQ